jgi:hypothetical protein
MPKKTILASLLIGIALVSGGYFFLNNKGAGNTSVSVPIPPQSDWTIYENTASKYRIQYPSINMEVAPLDAYDYVTPITDKSEIDIQYSGKYPVNYDAYTPSTPTYVFPYVGIIDWVIRGYTGLSADEKQKLEEYQKPILLDLKSFAETERMYSVSDQNPNIRNRQVGDLQEMTFASSTAYSFTLSGEAVRAVGSRPPSNVTYRYVFFESPTKEKFMMWYPANDPISQKIVDSFKFTDASSTPEWLTYTNTAGGYSIEYPSDLQPNTYDTIDLAMGGSGIETPANETSVTLSPKGTYDWIINVRTSRISYKTPAEWIAYINTVPSNVLIIQKHVNINGVDAIITESPQPASPYHKAVTNLDVFMVHDGLGYDISGSDEIASTTYEKVWSSFKFIPQN